MSLAWPIFIETALFMFLGFVDVLVLSSVNEMAASSVQVANQAVSVTTIVFTVVSTASAVMISQYLGGKRREDASRVAALSIVFQFMFGVVISAVFLLFSKNILKFIGAQGEVLEFSSEYLSVVGGFIFLQALLSAASVIIRNHGLTKISMMVTVGMNISNTLLDIVLAKGLFFFEPMGVKGVAIATVISRVLGTLVLFWVLFTKIEKISIFRLLKPFPSEDVKAMLKVGVPSALETFLYNVSQVVITSIVLTKLSDTDLAAKTFVQNATMFFYIFSVSIGQASQILVGHRVGAKEFDEAKRQVRRSYLIALGLSMSMCIIGAIFRKPLMGIFTDDISIIELGANLLLINIILELGRTTNLVVIASLRGAGDVVYPTLCAIVSMIFISTLGSYIFAVKLAFGIYGLWIALTADECFRGALMLLRFRSGKWKEKALK